MNWRAPAALLLSGLLASCGPADLSTLAPAGPLATEIANLGWLMTGLGTLVFIAVMGFLALALLRKRSPVRELTTDETEQPAVLWIGAALTVLVLAVVFAASLGVMRQLSGWEPERLTIEVTGKQWWWEVRYPQFGFTTANEIHIPVGERVQFELKSDNVIHSFWVPRLYGKMDLVPGTTTTFWLEASEPGTYQGVCAEFCGTQHAKMLFLVIAEAREDFDRWEAAQRRPAAEPVESLADRGQEVFLQADCDFCHTVRGTAASGHLGPDLTHFASRETLASAIVPNNRGHLAGWIVDPHGIKPGVLMPGTQLESGELQALLAYLESLE